MEKNEEEAVSVPLQLVMPLSYNPDPRYAQKQPPTTKERLPLGASVVCIQPGPTYGCCGAVRGYQESDVLVDLSVPPQEPAFGATIAGAMRDGYFSAAQAASASTSATFMSSAAAAKASPK